MPRYQKTFYRDLTFHVNRRKFGSNIPATDIDFLEYDNRQPISLSELKDKRSHWRKGTSWANIEATWNLAERANIPYYITEYAEDWSEISICRIGGIKGKIPIIDEERIVTLSGYIEHLYTIRNREVPAHIKRVIPQKLEPATRERIILELWNELNPSERKELKKKLY